MPKTNQGGATYAGTKGVVQHGAPLADGRVLSELDPERNLDGTLIDGEHPDREDGEEREVVAPTAPQPLEQPGDDGDSDVSRETPQPVDAPADERLSSAKGNTSTAGTTQNKRK
jgi:hypothetical protein